MKQWLSAGQLKALSPGSSRVFKTATLFRVGDRVFATENRCPHMGYPMNKGTIRDGVLTCAWHRWEFDLQSGGCYRGACTDLEVFPVRIENGEILVLLETEAPDLDALSSQLQEAMMEADPYLQAKAIAQLQAQGLGPKAIAEIAAAQAWRHGIAAHQSQLAVYELDAIVQMARLAEQLSSSSQVSVLLQGIRSAGGPSGYRPEVHPMPGPPLQEAELEHRLNAYCADASALGIERLLLSRGPTIDLATLTRLLLDASTRPYFLPLRGVVLSTCALIGATRYLGTREAERRLAGLAAWVLGARRPPPTAEQQEGIDWLQSHEAEIVEASIHAGTDEVTLEQLEETLRPDQPQPLFSGLLALLQAGTSPESITRQISILSARRFARLWLNNGGLWNSATEGFRICHGFHHAAAEPGRHRVQICFSLAFTWLESRWLQPGRAPRPDPAPQPLDWAALRNAIDSGDLNRAKSHLRAGKPSVEPADLRAGLSEILLREDHGIVQIQTLVAALSEAERSEEWSPYLLGLLSYSHDMRQSQEVHAAARFGKSFSAGQGGAEDT